MSKRFIQRLEKAAERRGSLSVDKITTGDFLFESCCDCSLRHIKLYEVQRGKTPSEDIILIHQSRDDFGTELNRYYQRQKKKKRGR